MKLVKVKMKGDAECITMTKKGDKLIFDIVVRNVTGLVFCLYINRINDELAIPSLTTRNPWCMNEVHERLGHANRDATRELVKGLNVIPGNMGVCWTHMVAKQKQKNVV